MANINSVSEHNINPNKNPAAYNACTPVIKAILFDMDGVLVDTERLMPKAAAEAFRDMGIPASEEDFLANVGKSGEVYFGRAAEKYGFCYTEEMPDRAYEKYGRMVGSEHVAKGAAELLKYVRDSGYKTALCSGACVYKIECNLRALGITRDFFDCVVTGEDVKNNKPDPEIYLKAIAALGVEPHECAVIEDSLNGIAAGRAAGAFTIGVGTSFSRADFEACGNCDAFVGTLCEAEAVLRSV